MIRFTMFEAMINKETINLFIPSMRCLFQFIQRLFKPTNKTKNLPQNQEIVPYRFLQTNLHKKNTFNIHLMKCPSKISSKGKNQLNKVHFCNRGKGFSVVDAFQLREALGYQMNLTTFNNTVESKLGLIDPLTLHNILSLRSRKKFPSLIIL